MSSSDDEIYFETKITMNIIYTLLNKREGYLTFFYHDDDNNFNVNYQVESLSSLSKNIEKVGDGVYYIYIRYYPQTTHYMALYEKPVFKTTFILKHNYDLELRKYTNLL